MYYTTLFSCWTLHDDNFLERQTGELIPTYSTDYSGFVSLMQELDGYNSTTKEFNDPSSRNRAIKSYLIDLTNNLRINTLSKLCFTHYRHRKTTKWPNDKIKHIPDICDTDEIFRGYHNKDKKDSIKNTSNYVDNSSDDEVVIPSETLKELQKLRDLSRSDDIYVESNNKRLSNDYLQKHQNIIKNIFTNIDNSNNNHSDDYIIESNNVTSEPIFQKTLSNNLTATEIWKAMPYLKPTEFDVQEQFQNKNFSIYKSSSDYIHDCKKI